MPCAKKDHSFFFDLDCAILVEENDSRKNNCFINLIELNLTNVLTGGIPYLEVIHGHGDGILKNWLRKHIKGNKDFLAEIPENNDGSTILKLKK